MNGYDDIIIGSGLGGLACGYMLSRHGRNVCVLERNSQVGGCLQTFRRGTVDFDTGFHYVGGLDAGQPLHRLFSYFRLLDLPWQRLDDTAFDEVVLGNRSFFFATGHDRFVETFAEQFPRQKENLKTYVALLQKVGDHLFDSLKPDRADEVYSTSLFTKSAYEFLQHTIDDPLLRQALSGTSLKMELDAETLPLYVFAQINNSFIQSAWRIRGGGQQIANRLAEHITAMGGQVRRMADVTRLVVENGVITAVEVNGQELIEAKQVISNAHPAATLALIDEGGIKKIYRNRITALPNTAGIFTANIRLKPNTLPYFNRNIYIHTPDVDLWRPSGGGSAQSAMVSCQAPESGIFTDNIDLLTPMTWTEVAQWEHTQIGRRGDDYVAMKQQKIEELLRLVEPRLPELHGAIDRIFSSTPISYQNYTRTVHGSAYGIRKDWNNPMTTILPARTPVQNLLLTGQSLNLHGVLGVTMTALFTCAHILGMDTVAADIMDNYE
ncbi:MAG: NAD(P)/FAD-dependent oxidoreductase [Prevotellaceae bacterium]|nr:NAD(P)/FAD-dependent oxidoreductase [Prevotellaceae bacterium]